MGLDRDVKSSEAARGNLLTSNLLTSNLLFGRPTECAGSVPGGEAAAHLCGSASFLHLHQQTKCKCLTRKNISSNDASRFCVYAGRVPAVLSVTGLLLPVLSCLSLLGSLIAAVNAGFVSCHNLLSRIMFHHLASRESLEFWDMMYYLCSFTLHPLGECWVWRK